MTPKQRKRALKRARKNGGLEYKGPGKGRPTPKQPYEDRQHKR
jgi:hypothetical protein